MGRLSENSDQFPLLRNRLKSTLNTNLTYKPYPNLTYQTQLYKILMLGSHVHVEGSRFIPFYGIPAKYFDSLKTYGSMRYIRREFESTTEFQASYSTTEFQASYSTTEFQASYSPPDLKKKKKKKKVTGGIAAFYVNIGPQHESFGPFKNCVTLLFANFWTPSPSLSRLILIYTHYIRNTSPYPPPPLPSPLKRYVIFKRPPCWKNSCDV